MQTRLARSWSALRYDLSSQRALDNAAKMLVEHDRILAEIDALAARLDAALPAEPTVPAGAQSTQRVA
ncbi:MAG: hypothetical protein ACLPVY_09930 [Acidimicrobiia bacterium]